jgi:hypothetical protein
VSESGGTDLSEPEEGVEDVGSGPVRAGLCSSREGEKMESAEREDGV